MDTQDRINLGQAKNQATMILSSRQSFFLDELEKPYKDLVRKIYKWNSELDAEILKTGEEGNKLTCDTSKTPITNKEHKTSPSPSPKQKYCPKCNVIIPKTWKKLIECGWKE